MATDARIAVGLPQHPKTKKLIKRLGQSSAWSLVCLILWAASNRSDGNLSGMSIEDIELAADWSGDDGAFVGALVDVRFLDEQDGGFVLHDWIEHNPWAAGADMRSAKARWNAAKRHHGVAEADRLVPEYAAIRNAASNAASNATSTDAAEDKQDSSNAPSPSPSPIPTSSSLRSGEGEAPRKRSAPTPAIPKPDDVDQQTWADWLSLRKAKKAPVTETVVNGARDESAKAGMTLDAFLQVWCLRGSQGLQADWLKPHELQTASRVQPMTFAQQAADIARTTVPSRPDRDPVLIEREADAKRVVTVPEAVRELANRLKVVA
jgi:hypothetical protein